MRYLGKLIEDIDSRLPDPNYRESQQYKDAERDLKDFKDNLRGKVLEKFSACSGFGEYIEAYAAKAYDDVEKDRDRLESRADRVLIVIAALMAAAVKLSDSTSWIVLFAFASFVFAAIFALLTRKGMRISGPGEVLEIIKLCGDEWTTNVDRLRLLVAQSTHRTVRANRWCIEWGSRMLAASVSFAIFGMMLLVLDGILS